MQSPSARWRIARSKSDRARRDPPAIAKHIVLAVVSLAIVYLLGRMVDWSAVGAAVRAAQPGPLLAGCLIVLLFPILNTLRWRAVLGAVGVPMTFGRCLRVSLGVWPLGTLTPSKTGEFFKAFAVRPHASVATGAGTALAERVVDVGVLGALGLAGGLATGELFAAAIGAAALAAALLSVPVLRACVRFLLRGESREAPAAGLRGRLMKKLVPLMALLDVLPRLAAQPARLAACAGASAANWMASMVQLWLLLAAFGAPAPLGLIVAILPAATFAGLLPVTIAGAGTRDGALLALSAGSIAAPALLAAGTVYTLTGYFGLGMLGLPFLRELRGERAREGATPAGARP